MRYLDFHNLLKDFTVFSLNDIRRVEQDFYRPRLIEWQNKGYIKKLTRGYYVFSDLQVDEGVLFEISNKIYAPSYVSLQMAFAYYGLIPESVYEVTAVATRRTYQFQTPLAQFSYRTIKPDMFFGYDLIEHRGKHFKMASPEKMFIDHLYLNPSIRAEEDFEGMRINKELFSKIINKRLIHRYALLSGQPGLSERIKLLLEVMNHA
ncbi:MAG: hypothetical protein HQL26_03705 [Candidatus Omnitrophica bacterium]|nr:hypothetical protein [Candidatus Omnitrophota bacterium]